MRIFGIILKTALFVLGIFILASLWDFHREEADYRSLAALPEHNYVPEVRHMMMQNSFAEAEELCDDIIREKLPGAEEAKSLKKICAEERASIKRRIRNAINGFITGSSNSLEETGGALVSDLLLYGDIRDLTMQGYFYVTGQETDPLIALLSSAGIATTAVQYADWMPAMLKLLRKTGALTVRFSRTLTGMVRSVLKTGKASGRTVQTLENLTKLLKRNSFPRSVRFLKTVQTPKDLALLSKLTAGKNTTPYLIILSGGEHGARLIRKHASSGKGLKLLGMASRRGPAGISWLARYKAVSYVKWGARITKIFRSGRAYELIRQTLKAYPTAKWGFLFAALLAVAYSATVFRELLSFRKKTKPESTPAT